MTTESDDRTAANSRARNRRGAASSRSGTAPTYEPLWLRQPARSPHAAASAGSTDPTAPTTASATAAPGTSRNAPFAPAPVPVPVRRNGFDRNTGGDDRFDRQPRARRFRRSAAGRVSGGSRRRRGKWLALVFGVLVVAVGAYGLNVATHRTQRDSTAAAESSAAATASTSSIPSLSALDEAAASVRLLAGGPDFLGNGGPASGALLRRPTSVARVGALLLIADAGSLRVILGDDRIAAVAINGLPNDMHIDQLASIGGRDVLAADSSSGTIVRLRGVGSDNLDAEIVDSTGIVAPVSMAGDGGGGALIADPGAGAVWRWMPNRPPARVVSGLLAPIGVAALSGGAAIVTDRGSGTVMRVDESGSVTTIAAVAVGRSAQPGVVTSLRATPLAAVPGTLGRVNVLLADGSMTSVPINPTPRQGAAVVTEYLRGPTALVADAGSTLVLEAGERRIIRVTTDAAGIVSQKQVVGNTRWPLLNINALLARDVVLVDPSAVVLAPDGSIVVADRGTNVLWRLSPGGQAARLAGTDTWGTTPDNPKAAESALASPADVAVGPDGTIYFTEQQARIRGIGTDGALFTVAEPQPDRPDQALFAPGPLAVTGASTLVTGDRFVGGLWTVTDGVVRAVGPANPAPRVAAPKVSAAKPAQALVNPLGAKRFVVVSREPSGSVIAVDVAGTAVRVNSRGVLAETASGLTPPGAVVKAGTSNGNGRLVILVTAIKRETKTDTAPTGQPDAKSDVEVNVGPFVVSRRSSIGGRSANDVVALASDGVSLVAAVSGVRASVQKLDNTSADTSADILTSTVLGPSAGRANELELIDPVGLDVRPDGSVLIADRGGARVRLLVAGLLTNVAGSGRINASSESTANADERSLGDLNDVITTRDATVVVADGDTLLQIDGLGLVRQSPVRDPDGHATSLMSLAEGADSRVIAVDTDGRLLRIERNGERSGMATVLTSNPPLAHVRINAQGVLWVVTRDGRVGQVRGDRFVAVTMPRDLTAVAVDEHDDRVVVVGRDGSVVERRGSVWRRIVPTTSVASDRRSTVAAARRPTDIALLPDGAVLVSDAGRDTVLVYRVS